MPHARTTDPPPLDPSVLQDLVDGMDDILYRLDADGRILWCNAAVREVLGYEPKELIGRNILDLYVRPEDRRDFLAALGTAGGTLRDFRARYRRRDGGWLWLSINAHYLYDGAGRVLGLEGTARDITVQQALEQALRESEQKFRILAETSGGIVFVYRERFLYTNPTLSALTGYSVEELARMDMFELVHPDHRALVRRRVAARLRGEDVPSRYEFKILTKAGETRWLSLAAGVIEYEGTRAGVATGFDITETKRAEVELRARLAQQATVAQLGQRALADAPLEALYRQAAEAVLEPLGADLAEVLLIDPDGDRLHRIAAAGGAADWGREVPAGPGSLAAYMLAQRGPVLIDPREDEPRFQMPPALRAQAVRSGISVIVHGTEGPVGLLCAYSRQRRHYRQDDANFMQAVANILGEAHERARRSQRLEARERQARAIAEAMRTYLTRGDWRAASAQLLAGALEVSDSAYGFLGVLADGRLRVLAHEGVTWDEARAPELYREARRRYEADGYLEFADFDNLFGHVLKTGESLFSNAPAEDPRAGGLPDGHPPLNAFLGVPIRKRDQTLGMIGVANRPGGYGPEQARTLELLADTAAVLYEAYGQQRQRDQAQAALQQREERLKRQLDALLRLAQDPAVTAGELDRALQSATRIAAQTLGVGRASVWFYTPDRRRLACAALYETAAGHRPAGAAREADRYPAYFRALGEDRVVDAADARRDPRSRELAADHLAPRGVTALLDAPIRRGGEVVGVVCHEHLDGTRPWSLDECNFAASVADTIALMLELHEHKEAERALRASEAKYRLLVDNARDAIFIVQDGIVKFPNPKTLELSGYTAEELATRPYIEMVAPEHRARVLDMHERRLRGEPVPNVYDFEIINKQGRRLWIEINAMVIPWEERPAILKIVRDVTRQKQAERALAEEKERAEVTLSAIADGVITTDPDGRIEYLNPVAESLTGWPRDLAAGRDLMEVLKILDEHSRLPVDNPASQSLRQWCRVDTPGHVVLVRADGEEFAIEYTASPILRPDGEVVGVVVVFRDVTEMRGLARQLSYQASHDALTGLINRREFENRLEYALESARTERKQHALCYLDLDQFKIVNDTCGHTAGDELLRQLAERLQAEIRGVDTLARLGGDEFGILLEGCPLDKAVEIADHLRRRLKEFRFAWEDKVFEVGGSIGLVPITAETGSLTEVMRAADSACYVAKDRGRDRVYVYQPDDEEVTRRHGEMQWVSVLRRALDEDRLELYFQPIHPLRPDAEAGLAGEILVRLRAENDAQVPPMAFIPAAERYHLMPVLDRWVLERVFDQLDRLPAALRAHIRTISVNLSGQSLSDQAFGRFVAACLERSALPAASLCFEITETAAIASPADALAFMADLKARGCRFALDDFGSGLSSFAYLKRLQVDTLKIDGHFVRDILEDPIDLAMVESINHIGHVMGLTTIAECVENPQVTERLRALGVDYAQGFGIAAPVPLAQALADG